MYRTYQVRPVHEMVGAERMRASMDMRMAHAGRIAVGIAVETTSTVR